jgi:pimeloyl-ACP methyl ester carboxylesterase
MKKYLLPLLVFVACVAQAEPRHVLVFIHGIGGDAATFGNMPEYFAKQGYEPVMFEYDTFNARKTVFDFSAALADFLKDYFSQNKLQSDSQISLIMHSQGGLVGQIWLFRSFRGDPGFNTELTPFVKNYITLGTPFWGAKVANLGSDIFTKGIPGNKQLEEMSFGSETFRLFQQMILDPQNQGILQTLRSKVRLTNIVGQARQLRALGIVVDGLGYESDTTVPIPAARFGFLHAKDIRQNYAANALTTADQFRDTFDNNFVLTEGWHVSPNPDTITGLPFTPKSCLTALCQHKPTHFVAEALKGNLVLGDEDLLSRASAFFVNLHLQLPEGKKLEAKEVKVTFAVPHSKLLSLAGKAKKIPGLGFIAKKEAKITIADPLELMSSIKKSVGDKGDLRLYYSGNAEGFYLPLNARPSGIAFSDQSVRMTIEAPGMKARIVEAKIRPTYTTFIDLNLESQ